MQQLAVDVKMTPADQSSPLARFIPTPLVRERHELIVNAPADVTMAAAERFDMHAIPIVSAIFRLRAWFMRATPPPRRWPDGFLAEMRAIGWGELDRQPGRLLAMGAVVQPWKGDVQFRAVPAAAFSSFAEPDLIKIAWTIETTPLPSGQTRLRTETRVVATDAGASDKFRRYWRFARFGIVAIRLLMLPRIRREAERTGWKAGAGKAA